MSNVIVPAPGEAAPDAPPSDVPTPRRRRSLKQLIGFENIGALYIWVAIIIVFSIWAPDTFPTTTTVKAVINLNAIAGIIALSLVVPLSAGVFDLSIGGAMGLASIFCAWLLVDQHVAILPRSSYRRGRARARRHQRDAGRCSRDRVVYRDSRDRISDDRRHRADFQLPGHHRSGPHQWDLPEPRIGFGLGDHFGRHRHGDRCDRAVGVPGAHGDWAPDVRDWLQCRCGAPHWRPHRRLQFAGLMVSATVACVAGILITSQNQDGQPDVGDPFLLSAFAAAFLGSTQFKGGRFYAWGTLVAVLVLGTGNSGLTLAGAPAWASDMFTGVVLLGALGLAAYERSHGTRTFVRALRRSNAADAEPTPFAVQSGDE